MSCKGRIINKYSYWKPILVPKHFMAGLCALSGHVGHSNKHTWNKGSFCDSR